MVLEIIMLLGFKSNGEYRSDDCQMWAVARSGFFCVGGGVCGS